MFWSFDETQNSAHDGLDNGVSKHAPRLKCELNGDDACSVVDLWMWMDTVECCSFQNLHGNGFNLQEVNMHFLGDEECGLHAINPTELVQST